MINKLDGRLVTGLHQKPLHQILSVPENFEYIWCTDINIQIWGCERVRMRSPNVLKFFKIFGYWENSGIHVHAPNVFKIFKILGYWKNSDIHVNAPNIFKIFEIVGYSKVSTRTSDIMTPLLNLQPISFQSLHSSFEDCSTWGNVFKSMSSCSSSSLDQRDFVLSWHYPTVPLQCCTVCKQITRLRFVEIKILSTSPNVVWSREFVL